MRCAQLRCKEPLFTCYLWLFSILVKVCCQSRHVRAKRSPVRRPESLWGMRVSPPAQAELSTAKLGHTWSDVLWLFICWKILLNRSMKWWAGPCKKNPFCFVRFSLLSQSSLCAVELICFPFIIAQKSLCMKGTVLITRRERDTILSWFTAYLLLSAASWLSKVKLRQSGSLFI